MNSAVETTSGSVVEQSINYKYDAFGNLVEEDVTVGGVTTTTQYGYDMSNPAKMDATGHGGSIAQRIRVHVSQARILSVDATPIQSISCRKRPPST